MIDLQYQHTIDELNRKIHALEVKYSRLKVKYEKSLGKNLKPQERKKSPRRLEAERYLRMYHNGNKELNFQQIADKCCLSRNYIAQISSELFNPS